MLNICYSSSLVIMLTINMIFTVDLSQNWATPLHAASQEGHDQVVELLLQAGASVDQKAKVRWESVKLCVILNSTHTIRC